MLLSPTSLFVSVCVSLRFLFCQTELKGLKTKGGAGGPSARTDASRRRTEQQINQNFQRNSKYSAAQVSACVCVCVCVRVRVCVCVCVCALLSRGEAIRTLIGLLW